MASTSDRMMVRSHRGANWARALFLTTLLAAALHLAHAPDALAAIAFVKNVGFLANSRLTNWAAYGVATMIIGLNVYLLFQTFFPSA